MEGRGRAVSAADLQKREEKGEAVVHEVEVAVVVPEEKEAGVEVMAPAADLERKRAREEDVGGSSSCKRKKEAGDELEVVPEEGGAESALGADLNQVVSEEDRAVVDLVVGDDILAGGDLVVADVGEQVAVQDVEVTSVVVAVVAAPAVAVPGVVDPAIVEPGVVDPAIVEPGIAEPAVHVGEPQVS